MCGGNLAPPTCAQIAKPPLTTWLSVPRPFDFAEGPFFVLDPFPPRGVTGTSCYCIEYNLHLSIIPQSWYVKAWLVYQAWARYAYCMCDAFQIARQAPKTKRRRVLLDPDIKAEIYAKLQQGALSQKYFAHWRHQGDTKHSALQAFSPWPALNLYWTSTSYVKYTTYVLLTFLCYNHVHLYAYSDWMWTRS